MVTKFIMRKCFAILICILCSTAASASYDFRVLTYNVFLRYPMWMFWDDHDERVVHMPEHFRGYDAVVLQEAFSGEHREQILAAVKEEYPYQSQTLGEDEFLSRNGGVVIFSRWPIALEKQIVFEACEGPDCLVKKGSIYVILDRNGNNIHLFGLHLQAEKRYGGTRLAQVGILQEFIIEQHIPADEAVLIAGDFNINYFSDGEDGEFSEMTEVLGVGFDEATPRASYDSSTNSLLADPVRERLDYVFHSQSHLKPKNSINQVKYLRKDEQDLSDHHAVIGDFRF